MKRVLILGVNGFIGHHLSKAILASTDWEVYGMDMQDDRIADLENEKRFRFFEGDITINREWIEYHVKKCDVVLPLVAIATPAAYVREFTSWSRGAVWPHAAGMRTIGCPALVVAGDGDWMCTPYDARRFGESLGGPVRHRIVGRVRGDAIDPDHFQLLTDDRLRGVRDEIAAFL